MAKIWVGAGQCPTPDIAPRGQMRASDRWQTRSTRCDGRAMCKRSARGTALPEHSEHQLNSGRTLTSVFCKKSIASGDAFGNIAANGRRFRMGRARM